MASHPLHTDEASCGPSSNRSEHDNSRNSFSDEGQPSEDIPGLTAVPLSPIRPKCKTCSTKEEQGDAGQDYVAHSEAAAVDQQPGPVGDNFEDTLQPKHATDPPSYKFWICISVIDVILCCFMGAIALYFVLQSRKRWRNYNEWGARIYLRNVRGFIIFSTVFGALIWLITIPIIIVTVANDSSNNSTS